MNIGITRKRGIQSRSGCGKGVKIAKMGGKGMKIAIIRGSHEITSVNWLGKLEKTNVM